MTIISFYINARSVRVFCPATQMKFSSVLRGSLWRKREVLATFCHSSMRRIIATDSRLQGALSCQVKLRPDKNFLSEDIFLEETLLKESVKLVDSKYLDLTSLSNESKCVEELLLEQEFKDILSRSLFHYDVNLADKSCGMLSPSELPSLVPYDELLNFGRSLQVQGANGEVLSEGSSKESNHKPTGKPSEEQLLFVIDRVTNSLLNFFEKPLDFTIYHKNIVFQNNIIGVTVKGISAYAQNMHLMKLYGYVHFAKVKVEILKVTHHLEDGSIRVRWRVNGVSRQKVLLMLWKLKSTKWKKFADEEAEWLDGFSVFSVGPDGLVYRHVCDKMIPDDETSAARQTDIRSRLLGLLGLAHRSPSPAGGLNAVLAYPRDAEINQGILSYEKLK